MERGQLDNTPPLRWAITLDVLTADRGVPRKKRFKGWTDVAEVTQLEPLVKGSLWSLRQPGLIELVVFYHPAPYGDAIFSRLEREGWPIAWLSLHERPEDFAGSLKWRPELQYVIDIPERIFMWGSRGITIAEVQAARG